MSPKHSGELLSTRRIFLALVAFLFGIYALSSGGHSYSSDEEGVIASTESLLYRGEAAVEIHDGNRPVVPVTKGRNGEAVPFTSAGQSVAIAPMYLVGSGLDNFVAAPWRSFVRRILAGWTNGFFTALGAGIFFLIALEMGSSRRSAAMLALIYGLGTFAWPHAKTMFSEPAAATLLLASLYAGFVAARHDRTRWLALSGLWAGLAMWVRPSLVIVMPLVVVYLVIRLSPARGFVSAAVRTALSFGGGCAVGLTLFAASNWWRFGSPLNTGYPKLRYDHPIHEGMYGLFLSPGKSLFLYAPIALVGVCAMVRFVRGVRMESVLLIAIVLVHSLFFSRFIHWHGDHSWGPRYLIMVLPLFALPVAPLLDQVRWRRATAVAGVTGFIVAILGTTIYFNQYFDYTAERLGIERDAEGPIYWDAMHFDPEWSPIVGHAKVLPAAINNSVSRLDGDDESLVPLPKSVGDRYGWYFTPPQLDSWVYWIFSTNAPKWLLFLAAPLFGFIGFGARGLRREFRREARASKQLDKPEAAMTSGSLATASV